MSRPRPATAILARCLPSCLLLLSSWVISDALRAAEPSAEFALGTAFTYRSSLQHQGQPADGSFDLSFEPEGPSRHP